MTETNAEQSHAWQSMPPGQRHAVLLNLIEDRNRIEASFRGREGRPITPPDWFDFVILHDDEQCEMLQIVAEDIAGLHAHVQRNAARRGAT